MPAAKPAARPAARKAATAQTAAPAAPRQPAAGHAAPATLRFELSAALHSRLTLVLSDIDAADDASQHRLVFSETLVELVNEGLDYYFIRTVKRAKAGFIVEQTANLGLVGVQRVMAPVIKQILGRMAHAQLQSVAASVRALMD